MGVPVAGLRAAAGRLGWLIQHQDISAGPVKLCNIGQSGIASPKAELEAGYAVAAGAGLARRFACASMRAFSPAVYTRVWAAEWVTWRLNCTARSMSKITEATRDGISDENFAFPKERKEPIHDAAHVRSAIARFKQVQGVSDSERDAAWKRIQSAAKKHKVELTEQDWREIG